MTPPGNVMYQEDLLYAPTLKLSILTSSDDAVTIALISKKREADNQW
jgi:hypothetical protein